MDEFKIITIMNEAMLKLLKDKNNNYDKNLKIKKFLEDEAFFFKINKSSAYEILQTIGVKEDRLEEVYKKLVSQNVYYDLLNKGKIDENDEYLVIKYDSYNYKDLFKKRK